MPTKKLNLMCVRGTTLELAAFWMTTDVLGVK